MERRCFHLNPEILNLSPYSPTYIPKSLLISCSLYWDLLSQGQPWIHSLQLQSVSVSMTKISIDPVSFPLRPSTLTYFSFSPCYWQILCYAFFSNLYWNLYSDVFFTLFTVVSLFLEYVSESVCKCIFYLVYCYYPEHMNQFSKKRKKDQFSGL